jgi:hypothetical protein
MGVPEDSLDVPMAQHHMNEIYICSIFQQMGGKTMPQPMDPYLFIDVGFLQGIFNTCWTLRILYCFLYVTFNNYMLERYAL